MNTCKGAILPQTGSHSPIRTCIGCRQLKSASELMRLTLDSEQSVRFDPHNALPGRGCHLCPSPVCLAKAIKTRAFTRAFRTPLPAAATAGLAAGFNRARADWLAHFRPSHRTALISARLAEAFGEPRWPGPEAPLDSLILTVLSQSTNDRNRDLAFARLREKFPDWQAVSAAETAAIAEAIRPAGLANQKSVRIRAILRWIWDTYGTFDLGFLCQEDPSRISATFMQLKGIGIKTISVVLMVSCGADLFPVDTHVHRICQRLGLVPQGISAEKTHHLMQPLVPAGKSYSLHMNFLRLGRTICQARKPRCADCPISLWCPSSSISQESD
jgi:endonuclease-3